MNAQDQLLEVAMRELARRHAEHLRALGPVRVLALDPCPRCTGHIIASEAVARCASCGWTYQPAVTAEPLASRRADQ